MTENPFKANTKVFASDNYAGAHPKIIEAVARYSEGYAPAYADDQVTKRVEQRFAEIFEHECAVFLAGTGTAANVLALSTICPPYGAMFCHPWAHVNTDETGAPEMYTGGAKVIEVDGPNGKIDIAGLEDKIALANMHGYHYPKPSVVCVTNQTEWGTVYQPAELEVIGEAAKRHSLRYFHDGARFANAVVALGRTPAEMTWKTGIEVMSFGATKGGAFAAEVIIFFNPADAQDFLFRRKRGGQLWSKHRFLSAQIDAYLEDDLWLKNAAHANAMAKRLADGLDQIPGVSFTYPVEGNELFPNMPEKMIAGLESDGFVFYRWLPGVIRLVTSFATPVEDVDAFLTSARKHASA